MKNNDNDIILKVNVDTEELKNMKKKLEEINELFPNIKVNIENVYITINHFNNDDVDSDVYGK